MVRHTVLLRLRDDAPPGRAAEIVAALEALPPLVPSIRRYDVRTDLGLAEGNAQVAVVAHFDDVAGYRAYRDHPDHQRVVQGLILPALESRMALQAQVEDERP